MEGSLYLIRLIEIKNFQSHKHTKIDLSNNINLIIGSSNSGKTAILRAIKWVVFNRPLGDSVVSAFADDEPTYVKIETTDNHIVEKVKSKKETYYTVDGEKLTAVKSSVPEKVKQVLNLDSLNFQFQHDNYFLLTESPANRTKQLNDLIGLSVADELIKTSKDMANSRKREIRQLQSNITGLTTDIASLDTIIQQVEPLITDYETMEKEVTAIDSRIKSASSLVKDIETIRNTIDELKNIDLVNEYIKLYEQKSQQYIDITKRLSIISKYMNLINSVKTLSKYNIILDKINNAITIRNNLDNLQTTIHNLSALISVYMNTISKLDKLADLRKLQRNIKRISSKIETLETIETKINSLNALSSKVLRLKKHIRSLKIEVRDLETKLKDNMGDVCPLCGTPLKKGVDKIG